MTNHDDHVVPDVTVSGTLALELLEILEWAQNRATATEYRATHEITSARMALDTECTASWVRQTHMMGEAT